VSANAPERVIAYIDGLNVYQGLVQKGWRDLLWLDFRSLVERMIRPDQTLVDVFYFTAHRRNPPASYARQQIYFNALDARGGVTRVEGRFERRKVPCVHCGRMTEIDRERATDVNMATQVLADLAHGRCDLPLLISGDSDYLAVVEHAQSLGRRIKIARPPARRSDELAAAADHFQDIRRPDVVRSQLPDPVMTPRGSEIRCPYEWLPLAAKIRTLSPGHQKLMQTVLAPLPPGREQFLHGLVDELHASEVGTA
jgi:uncharacterized LabA/DUF88 family protein